VCKTEASSSLAPPFKWDLPTVNEAIRLFRHPLKMPKEIDVEILEEKLAWTD
jgi:hypothetical protein